MALSKDICQYIAGLSAKPKNALRLMHTHDEMRFISNDADVPQGTFDGYQYYSVFSVGTRDSLQFTEDDKRFVLKGCRMSDVTTYMLRKCEINATLKLSDALKTSPAVECCGDNSLGDELKAVHRGAMGLVGEIFQACFLISVVQDTSKGNRQMQASDASKTNSKSNTNSSSESTADLTA